jgi:hypothetical protein
MEYSGALGATLFDWVELAHGDFTLLWFSGRSVFYRFDAYTLRHHRGPHDEAGRKAGCRKSACPV